MRKVALSLVLLSGCSWLFQEHLASDRRKTDEPRCSTTPGWWLLDALLGAGNGLIAIDAASANPKPDNANAVLAGALVGLVIHTASGISGERWAAECHDAQRAWDRGERGPVAPVDVTAPKADAEFCFGYDLTHGGHQDKCKPSADECERMRAQILADETQSFANVSACEVR